MNKFGIRNIVQTAAIAGIASVTVVVTGTPSMAYTCDKPMIQAEGTMKSKFSARAKAKNAWTAKVKNVYGLPYSVWSIAINQSLDCHQISGKYTCKAEAKPCLYVVQ